MGNIKTIWTDPVDGKEFSYGWGFNTGIKKEEKIILTYSGAIARHKNEHIMALFNEKEKEIMEKISYVCGRCKNNDTPCSPRCVDCDRGSNFVEKSKAYAQADDRITKQILNSIYGARANAVYTARTLPAIKDVKFNPPATIVFWADNTKTVVKCQDCDVYDPEKGLAMAIIKKLCGNKGNYNNLFHKWIPETVKPEEKPVKEAPAPATEQLPWLIWFQDFDVNGKQIAAGILPKVYKRKCDATRKAKNWFAHKPTVKWVVSQTNPFVKEG